MELKTLLAAVAAITTISGPAVARVEEALPPPYEGVYQPHGVDEIGLWREDDEDERILAASPLVIRDENLSAYVKHVLCETVGQDRCSAVRIYIIRNPAFNASMSPNGTMRVFTGLFLRIHNEAELGALLGHEFGHFESRHTLSSFRAQRSGADVLAWSALLASTYPSNSAMQNFQNTQLAVYGGLFRHDRDQERQADFLSIAYLNKSQLRPQAAAEVWKDTGCAGRAARTPVRLKRTAAAPAGLAPRRPRTAG